MCAIRCLVVDDEPDNADSLAMVLPLLRHDLKVVTAYSAPQALAVAAAFLPDIAFVDIWMGQHDGYWLAQQFRRDPVLQRTVLVAHTGLAKVDDAEEALAHGFDVHIRKPAEPSEIEAAIERAFAIADARGGSQLATLAPEPSRPLDTAEPSPGT
jgi:CheY-like chemotaxis protein